MKVKRHSSIFNGKSEKLILLVFMLLPVLGFSDIINVPADFTSIQQGINASNNGDTVLVAPGTYVENINFSGKAIHVLSEQGPEQTIIDGNQAGSCISFKSGEDENSLIDGFTLTNGSGTYNPYVDEFIGGGIYMTGNVSPIIQNNIITQNTAFAGAGIAFRNQSMMGSPSLINNVVTNNNKDGIIIVMASSVTITGNTVSQNTEKGIYIWFVSESMIHDNNIIANSDDGAYFRNCTNLTISENLIENNGACGIYQSDIEISTTTGNTVTNNQDNGICIQDCSVHAEVSDNMISNNSTDGLYLRDSESILVMNNQINGNATGIYTWFIETLSLVNNLIYSNGSDGVSLRNVISTNIVNTTCVNNEENGFRLRDSDVIIIGNSIIRGNDDQIFVMWDGAEPTITYSNVEDGYTGIGNIDEDPLFVDAASGNYQLLSGSPSIDAGNNSSVPEGVTLDLAGSPRFWDDPNTPDTGNGDAPIVDMGAYEWPIMYMLNFIVSSETDPIEGAIIAINSTQVTTNSNGKASIPLLNGDYDYTVSATGFNNESGNVNINNDPVTELVYMTTNEHAVAFHIFDSNGDIEGAEVIFNGGDIFYTDETGIIEIGEFPNGTYTYVVNAEGHEEFSGELIINGEAITEEVMLSTVAVEDLNNEQIIIYPNPAKDHIYVTNCKDYNLVEITDISGRTLESIDNIEDHLYISLTELNKGIYFINMYQGKVIKSTVKLLIIE